jgi:hypothetical protein
VRKLFAGDATGSAQIEGFLAENGSARLRARVRRCGHQSCFPRPCRAREWRIWVPCRRRTLPIPDRNRSVKRPGHVVVDSHRGAHRKEVAHSQELAGQDHRRRARRGRRRDRGPRGSGDVRRSDGATRRRAPFTARWKRRSSRRVGRRWIASRRAQAALMHRFSRHGFRLPLARSAFRASISSNLPKIKWDFPTREIPKPNLPQPPAASDAQAVDKIHPGARR